MLRRIGWLIVVGQARAVLLERRKFRVRHYVLENFNPLIQTLELALRPTLDSVTTANFLENSGAYTQNACCLDDGHVEVPRDGG